MSPTILEIVVGLVAAVLAFMLAVHLIPLIIDYLAAYFNRSVDDTVERKDDHYER